MDDAELRQLLDTNFAEMRQRFDAMEMRFAVIDGRFDAIDGRFDAMDGRFDAMDGRFDAMDGRMDAMDGRFDAMDGRFDAMDGRMDAMDGRIDASAAETRRHFDIIAESLRHELQLAAEGTAGAYEKIDRLERELTQLLASFDTRLTRLEATSNR